MGQKGEQLTEFGEMVQAGAVAVSDDGKPVEVEPPDAHRARVRQDLRHSGRRPLRGHVALAGGRDARGTGLRAAGLKGIPSAAEEIMVARDIILAELTGGHVHLCHMSTRGSVELIRWAKAKGLRVTAEATPHHFTLTHERCDGYDTNAKMNPPLREDADREAIRQGLKDGTIDCIASDHAPHHYDTKEREFDDAPNGIIGLETAFGLASASWWSRGCSHFPS